MTKEEFIYYMRLNGAPQEVAEDFATKFNFGHEPHIISKLCKDLRDGKVFFCDPDKNEACKKTICYINGGDCMLTQHKEFKK